MKEYGITTSQAHVWVHVCPKDLAIYWYLRKRMVERLSVLPERVIASAKGRLCRLFGNRKVDGGFIYAVDLPVAWWAERDWYGASSDREVGQWAEDIFRRAVQEGFIGIPACCERYDDAADQFTGRDFRLIPALQNPDYEIKADVAGGEWGSGNLFIQTHELHHQHGQRNAHREVA